MARRQPEHNYGLAIIVITLIVRLAIFPFMMRTYKNQMMMREKMKIVKPEMEEIQKKTKVATTQEEKMEAQQEMMALYKKHGINPLNMGCLPILIQMPVVMALYFALKFPSEGSITEYPDFLWMNLTEVDFFHGGDRWYRLCWTGLCIHAVRACRTAQADAAVHVHFSNNDHLDFIDFPFRTPIILGSRWCIPDLPDLGREYLL